MGLRSTHTRECKDQECSKCGEKHPESKQCPSDGQSKSSLCKQCKQNECVCEKCEKCQSIYHKTNRCPQCHNCSEYGHIKKKCKNTPKCGFCKEGHTKIDCPEKEKHW